jgi:dimethylglycine dehydrogenase
MKSLARVFVIGGGVVGVSTLYHVVKKGCSDVVLIERTERTADSIRHAADPRPCST